MWIRGIRGIDSQAALRDYILKNGPYDQDRNEQIYREYFTRTRPRDTLFEYLDRVLNFTAGAVADIGCHVGMNLVYCSSSSYGIELRGARAAFAKSLGLTVYECNFLSDDISHLPHIDTIWCAATLEHVDAPHVLLRRAHYLLKENGRIIVETPCVVPNQLMKALPLIDKIYGDHDDHVNSFSQTSLIRTCEMAGFAEEFSFRYSTPLVKRGIPPRATGVFPLSLLGQSVVFVGRKMKGWNYPSKASREATDSGLGYEFKSKILSPY
jgi:SAM-dependent methyltransferase